MKPSVAEVLESAKSLDPEERADVAHELLLSLGQSDSEDATKLEALRELVAVAEASIAAGKGIDVSLGQLREFVREVGREAMDHLAGKTV